MQQTRINYVEDKSQGTINSNLYLLLSSNMVPRYTVWISQKFTNLVWS